jgi:uncharacterized protein YjbI with pentapeptide repeats
MPLAIVVPLSLVFGVAGMALLWLIPMRQARTLSDEDTLKRFDAENEARRTLAQVLGGALVLISLYFSAKTLNVSQEGQITDRFVKGLDLLCKKDNIEARLGGVYSLARIANDSQRDHMPTMKILAASLRQMSKPAAYATEPPPDLQAILEVIVNRNLHNETAEDQYIDLRGIAASKIYLINGKFIRLNLLAADLSYATLNGSTFQDVFAQDANLKGAWLKSATMTERKVNFKNAHLEGAHLDEAKMRNVYFYGAYLEGASFQNAVMEGCNFNAAHLQGVRFEAKTLENTWFNEGADLRGADFRGVRQMRHIDLTGAQVDGLKVTQEQMHQVILSATQLARVIITKPSS